MSFFGSIGKALKNVGKTLKGVVKTVAPVVAGALAPQLGAAAGTAVGNVAGLDLGKIADKAVQGGLGNILGGAAKIGGATPLLSLNQSVLPPPTAAQIGPAPLPIIPLAATALGLWLLIKKAKG
jgi:hypothetical protein